MGLVIFTICLAVIAGYVSCDDLAALTSASSEFSQRLYKEIAAKERSACYSPYSIHQALAMTYLGAREETATEMSNVLGLTSLSGARSHQAYKLLNEQMKSVTDVKLYTANGVFVNPAMPIEPQFLADVNNYYQASAANFDLAAAGGPEKIVNEFVEQKTNNKIKQLLPKGAIDQLTIMVLVNTIFFNGTWNKQFLEYKTGEQDFRGLNGENTKVNMMRDTRYMNIKRNVHGVDVAELLFKGGKFSMFILLPQEINGITALENSLTTPGRMTQYFNGLSRTYVNLSIPKFKVETSFKLKTALMQLGMLKSFDPNLANFKGISKVDGVHIDEVYHKALIDVQETGTVAAAATAPVMTAKSGHFGAVEEFKADHPFIGFIRDNEQQNILFQFKFSN